jgi:hypothetical protein
MIKISEEIKNKKISEIKKPLEDLNIALLKLLYPKGIENLRQMRAFPLIDFTSVWHYNEKELRTVSKYRTNFELDKYNKKLRSFFKKDGFSFPVYEKHKQSTNPYYDWKIQENDSLTDVGDSGTDVGDSGFDYFDSGRQSHRISPTNLESWNTFVKDEFSPQVNSCYTYFEKILIDEKNNKFFEIGIYLLCREQINENLHQSIEEVLSRFVKQNGSSFIVEELNERHNAIEQSLRQTSLKSSLAAVMSRNMSHNIGSHVLNKLSSGEAIHDFFKIKGVNRFVQGESIKGKIKFNFPDLSITSEAINEDLKAGDENEETIEAYEQKLKKNSEYIQGYNFYTHEESKPIYTLSPFFVDVNNNTRKEELARVFNDYLKKRMDFVADVATSNKALLSNSKYLFADVFRGFERNLLLLHNISGKEDKFSYNFDFQYSDGTRDDQGNLTTANYYIEDKNEVRKKNPKFIDPIVAVPNDILGSQAFYIILENIIRNTAKHSGCGKVIFTIKVEDIVEDDFYRVTVFDNVRDENENKLNNLIAERNVSIAQDVLDENNEIRTAGWGTIEIKLAACYLSGLDMLRL